MKVSYFVILFKIASVSITVISYLFHFNYHKHVVNRNLIFNDHILIVIGVSKIELQQQTFLLLLVFHVNTIQKSFH